MQITHFPYFCCFSETFEETSNIISTFLESYNNQEDMLRQALYLFFELSSTIHGEEFEKIRQTAAIKARLVPKSGEFSHNFVVCVSKRNISK